MPSLPYDHKTRPHDIVISRKMTFMKFYCLFYCKDTPETRENYTITWISSCTLPSSYACLKAQFFRKKCVHGKSVFTMAEAKPNFDLFLGNYFDEISKDDISCTKLLQLPSQDSDNNKISDKGLSPVKKRSI